MTGQANKLGCVLFQSEIYRASNGASVQPAVGIDANGAAGELPEVAWLVYGLQKCQQP